MHFDVLAKNSNIPNNKLILEFKTSENRNYKSALRKYDSFSAFSFFVLVASAYALLFEKKKKNRNQIYAVRLFTGLL